MLPDRHDFNRRDWMRSVLLQAAGASALIMTGPAAAESLPNDEWRPGFLTEAEDRALIALGERIVPGSGAANCNRVIDLILSIETQQAQQDFRSAMAAFQQDALRRFGKDLGHAAPAQIDELLTAAVAENAVLSMPFGLIKEWIADAYWSSQEGMRELGWKGGIAWDNFDGCPHAGAHS